MGSEYIVNVFEFATLLLEIIMKNLLVSINCITYNHEKYIEDAIKGFLMQKTNFDFEILIHDDASTDGTPNIIKEYQKMYPDIIKPILQVENQYSKGVERIAYIYNDKRSKGKYIALCEGDDYWTDPHKLQKQVDYMEINPECSMCFHASEVVDANKSLTGKKIKPYHQNCISPIEDNIIIGGGLCPTASLLYRKELIENMPKFYMNAHIGDYPLQMILATRGYIYYIDEFMSAYRSNIEGSWTNTLYSGENSKEKIVVHNSKIIELLNEFNKYTNYGYSTSVEKKILIHNANIALISGNIKQLKSKPYKKYYNKLGIKRKIKLYFQYYFPNFYKKIAVIKGKTK